MTRDEAAKTISDMLAHNRYAECYVRWTCAMCEEVVMHGKPNELPADTTCPGCGSPHFGAYEVHVKAPLFGGEMFGGPN